MLKTYLKNPDCYMKHSIPLSPKKIFLPSYSLALPLRQNNYQVPYPPWCTNKPKPLVLKFAFPTLKTKTRQMKKNPLIKAWKDRSRQLLTASIIFCNLSHLLVVLTSQYFDAPAQCQHERTGKWQHGSLDLTFNNAEILQQTF